jgi:hypothetical protein
MAGTTGLEPATSAVTVNRNPVTYSNNGQWMAPFSANRHTKEQLSWPYRALDFDLIYPQDLCRPAALVALFRPFLCPRKAEVPEPKVPNLPKPGHKGTIAPTRILWLSPVLELNGYEFNLLDLRGRWWQT